MTRVRFVAAAGIAETEAAPGTRLLDVGQGLGMPLEGTCGGELACATCHVVVATADWPRLPPAGEEEEDLLDLLPNGARHSRLSCQVRVPEGEPLTVTVPL